jgi:hypothetical protein
MRTGVSRTTLRVTTANAPCLAEISAIGTLGEGSVILIDDARLFLAPPPEPHDVTQWPTFDQILLALRTLSDGHEVMVVNDVIVFYPRSIEKSVDGYARHHGVDWLRARQSLEENVQLRADLEAKQEVIVSLREELANARAARCDARGASCTRRRSSFTPSMTRRLSRRRASARSRTPRRARCARRKR